MWANQTCDIYGAELIRYDIRLRNIPCVVSPFIPNLASRSYSLFSLSPSLSRHITLSSLLTDIIVYLYFFLSFLIIALTVLPLNIFFCNLSFLFFSLIFTLHCSLSCPSQHASLSVILCFLFFYIPSLFLLYFLVIALSSLLPNILLYL